ncbi:MAG TPA: DUF2505 family protein [Brevibacterium sp.]|nr:DUF2505 family protein [Brevibacterium sp.]
MKTFTLTGASPLSPARLRAGLLDPATWHRQDGAVESAADDALTASFPLGERSVPDSLSRFVPDDAVLRITVRAAAEAAAGSPQTARLTVTVPGAPVTVRVELTARPADTGSTVGAAAELESSVPLFGPMVESALEPVVRSQLREKLDQLADLR